MAAVFAALATFALVTVAAGKAYADGSVTVANGDYTYEAYFDGGSEPGSVFVSSYSGSDTQLILPTSFTKNGIRYPAANGGEMMIGKSAFEGNAKIEKVAMPVGIDAISERAFAGCTSLTEVAVGGTTNEWGIYFGTDVFVDCPNLKTYYLAGCAASGIESSGIGQSSKGEIYAGVTVYTVEGSDADKDIQKINAKAKEADANANQITLVYVDDPYSKHTVKPTTGGDSDGDKPLTIDPTKQMGADKTPYGKGASAEAAETAITKYAKEADPKGTVFNLLQAKVKKITKSSIALTWKKPAGTKKFVIYGNKCGKTMKQVKLATTTKTTLAFKKVAKKAVKKGTYYKFTIVALDKTGAVVSTSKIIHVATPGGKYTNDKKVTTAAKKNAVTLKKGKKFNLKAKAVAISKKLKRSAHRGLAFESSKKAVATVDKKGVITAKKKGTCYVYAYAQNGVCAKVKVTVK